MACSKPLIKDRQLRLILTGLTGVGKSSFGNVLHGSNFYETSHGLASKTKKCELHSSYVDGYLVTTIDTPGFYDTNSNFDFDTEMENCITLSLPGPHVIVYIIPLRCRFTKEHFEVLEKFIEKFGNNVQKYFFLVLTYFDEYKKHNKSSNFNLEALLQDLNPKYKSLLQNTFENRYFPFDNTVTGSERVEQIAMLLQKITETVEANGNQYYTNCEFQIAARIKREKEKEKERQNTIRIEDRERNVMTLLGFGVAVWYRFHQICTAVANFLPNPPNQGIENNYNEQLRAAVTRHDIDMRLGGNRQGHF